MKTVIEDNDSSLPWNQKKRGDGYDMINFREHIVILYRNTWYTLGRHLGARWCCTADKGPKLLSYRELTHNSNNLSTNWSAALEHVLPDKNTFLRLHTFDLVWSKQQVLVGNRRLYSLWLAVSSKSNLKWYRVSVLVSCLKQTKWVCSQSCYG